MRTDGYDKAYSRFLKFVNASRIRKYVLFLRMFSVLGVEGKHTRNTKTVIVDVSTISLQHRYINEKILGIKFGVVPTFKAISYAL